MMYNCQKGAFFTTYTISNVNFVLSNNILVNIKTQNLIEVIYGRKEISIIKYNV